MKPIYLELETVGILALCGLAGSGKTSTMRFLIAQSILSGFDTYVADPHGNFPTETLATSLVNIPIAIDKSDRIAMLRMAHTELKARLSGSPNRRRMVVFFDETPAHFIECTRVEIDDQAKMLLDIANEGRKAGIHIVLSGQNWKQDFIGSRSIRSSITHVLFHRISQDEVKLFAPSMPASIARKISGLKTGHMLSYPALQAIRIPYVTADDLKSVCTRFARPLHAIVAPNNDSVQKEDILHETVKSILHAIDSGEKKEDTIKRMFGTYKSGSNPKWKAASKLYDSIRSRYRA